MGEAAKARRGGRRARRALRSDTREQMLPNIRRGIPLLEPMGLEQIDRIDRASMAILEEVGVIFRDPIALDDWRKAGARVDGERVYFDRDHIRELIATVPSDIRYYARNPQNNVEIGGPNAVFVPMTGAPSIRDLANERRWPTEEESSFASVSVPSIVTLHKWRIFLNCIQVVFS